MFKYRIRMFFNELKVLVFMRSDSRQSGSDTERRSTTMRDLGMSGCGWPPFVDCHSQDDEEEYYGSDPRPRSLAFEDKEPKLQVGLDAVSLASTASSLRTPQCRICFQGPEQVDTQWGMIPSCWCNVLWVCFTFPFCCCGATSPCLNCCSNCFLSYINHFSLSRIYLFLILKITGSLSYCHNLRQVLAFRNNCKN